MQEDVRECLASISGYKENAPLSAFTTFKIGGPADVLVKPETIEELQKISTCLNTYKLSYTILGGGSNVLISDEGIRGVVIIPSMKDFTVEDCIVKAGSGMGLQKFLHELQKKGLSGLEHLVGIPGSLGGALTGNAGTAFRWINEKLIEIESVNLENGEHLVSPTSYAEYEYRDSRFKKSQKEIIVFGKFSLSKDDPEHIQETMSSYLAKRNKQPAGNSCAGCIFRNPKEAPSGMIIDQLGLKGKKIGGARISKDHGNFIVNDGKATAKDVITLISYVKQQVRDKRGIQLQEEIKYLGF